MPGNFTSYCTLNANIQRTYVGAVAGGRRLNVTYVDGWLSTDKSDPPSPVKAQLNRAKIVNGSDWVVVTDDGVIEFDSRITITLAPPTPNDPAGPPISVRLQGRVDLRNYRQKDNKTQPLKLSDPKKVLSDWEDGFEDGSYLPVVLVATIDVPIKGFNATEDAAYKDCLELGRSILLGTGNLQFQKGEYGNVKSIELDLGRYVQDGSIVVDAAGVRLLGDGIPKHAPIQPPPGDAPETGTNKKGHSDDKRE